MRMFLYHSVADPCPEKDSTFEKKPDPDPNFEKKLDPDPTFEKNWIRIRPAKKKRSGNDPRKIPGPDPIYFLPNIINPFLFSFDKNSND